MAVSASQTFLYKEDWAQRLQDRLDEPNVWKEVCDVMYSDMRILNWPYMADITLETPTRSSPYTYQALTQTNETLTINQQAIAPMFIHKADMAQSGYTQIMELADRQFAQLDEQVETYVWQQKGTFQYFDNASIGGAAGSITVNLANVDDILRNVRRLIFAAKGGALLNQNGGFFVWDPADFMQVEAFAQANGFQEADRVLKNGIPFGFHYGGFDHYVSNRLANTSSMAAGVKKIIKVGVLKATYGDLMVDEQDPGSLRGTGIVSSIDYGVQNFESTGSLVFNIQVSA